MRLDHLLSKDRFVWGWLPGCWFCLGRLLGLGRSGAAPAEGWAAGRVSWVCSRGWGWLPGVWCRRHILLLLLPAFVWGVGLVGAPACWGWHAVGVLGQCALVAWPVLLLPVGGWWGVGVGGLVVNCIVDASILL